MPRPHRSDVELVNRCIDLREQDGWNDRLSFHPRVFCQLALPYKQPSGNPSYWRRQNGPFVLTIRPAIRPLSDGTEGPGYPTGVIPRLVLTWLATEVARQKEWEQSPEIQLGNNLTHFMREIGLLNVTGGKNGSISRLRESLNRLFDAVITAEWIGDRSRDVGRNFLIAAEKQLWWGDSDRNAGQQSLLPSTVRLSEEFYRELREHPVPVSFQALRELQSYGAQALDIYTWLTHRMSFLSQPRMDISWEQLRGQSGSNTADDRFGRAKFRRRFKENLRRVLTVYDLPFASAAASISLHVMLRWSPCLSSATPHPQFAHIAISSR